VFSAFTSSSHQSDNRNVEQMEFEIHIQHQKNRFEIELQEKQNEIDCLKQKLEKSDKLINSILKEKSDNEEKLKVLLTNILSISNTGIEILGHQKPLLSQIVEGVREVRCSTLTK
ncbi:hypothetical protein ROZALSC1DRAFT_24953, partial [Rozella allomycis CSF55]